MEKLATLGSRIKWVVDRGWFEPLDHFVNSGIVKLERRPNSWSLQVPNHNKGRIGQWSASRKKC